MTDQGLFTAFMREQRPLSFLLRGRREVRGLLEAARSGSRETLEGFRGAGLAARVASVRAAPPVLGPLGMGSIAEGDGELREVATGVRVPTSRFYARYKLDGDIEVLQYWPDEADACLKTVDAELIDRIGGYENLNAASASDLAEYWRLNSTWRLGTVTDQGPWALYTYVDLTREEEKDYARDGTFAQVVAERYARMAPVVQAIAAQTDRFFDEQLPAEVAAIVADREAVLADRAAIVRSLELPSEWAPEPVVLEQDASGPLTRHAAASADRIDDAPPGADLDIVGQHYRLSPKSFGEVLRTIRTWADAVEGNPRGFGHLDEDSISDLLAATLNATTPGAGREVYSRSGRTDIYIDADTLSAGSGPARVFICESKWADGRGPIISALEDQIFRYATAHTTSAVLLALCRQKKFHQARERVRAWAAEAKGWTGTERPSAVESWPTLTYRSEGRLIEVCLATVSIPQVTTRGGLPK